MTETALSLGGNTGNVRDTFRKALKALEHAGMENIRLSSLYSTSPVDCEPGTPDFINAALTGNWNGTVKELRELCKFLETEAGRPEKHPRYASRPLDIDIIFFGTEQYSDEELIIPHKEAEKRLFVLIPLAETAGNWIFPGKNRTVAQLTENLKKQSCPEEYKKIISSKQQL